VGVAATRCEDEQTGEVLSGPPMCRVQPASKSRDRTATGLVAAIVPEARLRHDAGVTVGTSIEFTNTGVILAPAGWAYDGAAPLTEGRSMEASKK
jgi:hypothetical protein